MRFKNLPETMPSKELELYFRELVYEVKNKHANFYEIIDDFYELSDKQWHNYELPEDALRLYLDEFIEGEIYDVKLSIDLIQKVAQIIAYLGLVKSYDKFKKLRDSSILSENEKKAVTKIIDEIGDSAEDPYKHFWQ